jgi:hypothetical protein
MFMSEQYENLRLPAKLGASVFSNSAMGFGFQLFIMFEGTGGCLFNLPASLHDNFLNNLKSSMIIVNRMLGHIFLTAKAEITWVLITFSGISL